MTTPRDEPRLFVGGPWHGRIVAIPAALYDYRVPVITPGRAATIVLYHRRTVVLTYDSAVRVFVRSGADPSNGEVADAMARAAGLSILER